MEFLVAAQLLGMLAWATGKLRVKAPKESFSFEVRTRYAELVVGAFRSPTTSTGDAFTPGPKSRSRCASRSLAWIESGESCSKKISLPVKAAAQARVSKDPTNGAPFSQRGRPSAF